MSKTVVISGSRSIKVLPSEAIASINRIMELKFLVLVGDAPGIDSLVVDYLRAANYRHVHVYYALFNGGGRPRLRYRPYHAFGIRGNYSDRDIQMCWLADYGLAIWDGQSKGTAANIARVKKTKVIRC